MTVPSSAFATQTPPAPTATPRAPRPTASVSVTRFVRGSIRATPSSSGPVTQTRAGAGRDAARTANGSSMVATIRPREVEAPHARVAGIARDPDAAVRRRHVALAARGCAPGERLREWDERLARPPSGARRGPRCAATFGQPAAQMPNPGPAAMLHASAGMPAARCPVTGVVRGDGAEGEVGAVAAPRRSCRRATARSRGAPGRAERSHLAATRVTCQSCRLAARDHPDVAPRRGDRPGVGARARSARSPRSSPGRCAPPIRPASRRPVPPPG